jgi:hypothetical protein
MSVTLHQKCLSCEKTTMHFSGKCQSCRRIQGLGNNSKKWGGSNRVIYDEMGFAKSVVNRSNKLIKKVTSG